MALQSSGAPAATAALDDLYERGAFEKLLGAETARMRRYGGTFSLLLFELDAGGRRDEPVIRKRLLVAVAELLRRHVRGSDYAAHWGGERFAIMAPATDLTEAAGFAVKIRRLIAEHPFEDIGNVSASIGVAEPLEDETPEALLVRCEKAMQSAGEQGGNRIAVDKTD